MTKVGALGLVFVAIVTIGIVALPNAAQAQGCLNGPAGACFQGIGMFDAGASCINQSYAEDINKNGTRVVGTSYHPSTQNPQRSCSYEGISWTYGTAAGNFNEVGFLNTSCQNNCFSWAYGISNGAILAGISSDTNGFSQAFTGVAAGYTTSPTGLGFLNASNRSSFAFGIGGDGANPVGYSTDTSLKTQAFDGVCAGGNPPILCGLGFLDSMRTDRYSIGYRVNNQSANNNVRIVAGESRNSNGQQEAVRWVNGIIGSLGTLTNLPTDSSAAYDLSRDGSVVVGMHWNSDGANVFRWENGSSGFIQFLPGTFGYEYRAAVSENGQVVVGGCVFHQASDTVPSADASAPFTSRLSSNSSSRVSFANPPVNGTCGNLGRGYVAGGCDAFRWTAATGAKSIRALLVDAGINMTGWTLPMASGISGDGSKIVGYGIDPNGNCQGWVAHLPVSAAVASHDFNGDGISDILLENTGGGIALLLMNNNAAVQSAVAVGSTTPNVWTAIGQRDINGDKNADILFRATDGSIAVWLMNSNGTVNSANGLGNPTTAWNIVGTGDFNNDGIGDVLFRGGGTAVAIWYMNNTGGLGSAVGVGSLPSDWTVAGTGDFDGDGVWDILWYNTNSAGLAAWLMNANGTVKSAVAVGALPSGWSVAGTGDFNGDSISDVLLSAGLGGGTTAAAIWFMNSSGGIGSVQGVGTMVSGWTVAQTGDYNGDGNSDILWYASASGGIATWLLNGATVTGAVGIGSLPPASWMLITANSD